VVPRRMDGWMPIMIATKYFRMSNVFVFWVFSSCTRTITNSLTGLYILRLAIN
jgi:hypothetical protein